MATRVWVFDTSSLIAIKSTVPRDKHDRVFNALTRLVRDQRLFFPREVLGELRRERRGRWRSDAAYDWAMAVAARACGIDVSFEEVRAALATVPEAIDPAADSDVEEADVYVLALGKALRSAGRDPCVVTEETQDAASKVSLHTACGVLRVPSVPLHEFLRATTFRGTRPTRRVRTE